MKYEVLDVPAIDLSVDPTIQRALDPRRVGKLAAEWSEESIGILTVSRRASGETVVIDGQTRLAAFRAVCGEGTVMSLRCDVYTGLVRQEEAAMFLAHNDRKAVRPVDRFRLALIARELWAVSINVILETHDWKAPGTVSESPTARSFTAVTAAEKIYRKPEGERALVRAFETITSAWGHASGAASAEAVHGVGGLYALHPEADGHAFTAKLAKMRPGEFIGDIAMSRRSTRESVSRAAYLYAVTVYNKHRRGPSAITPAG